MAKTDFKRIARAGLLNFIRNGFVTLASVLVITITLFVIGFLVFFSAMMNASLEQIRNKVDVDVYFVTTALEEDVLGLKNSLERLPEVQSVAYTSRETALEQFKDRHSGDFLTLQALEELGENPLGASLNIRAKETSQYEAIARFLEDHDARQTGDEKIIDKINYYQNKVAIDKLTKIIDSAETLGFGIVLLLSFIAIMITFNTVRLAIYTSREEIGVMRLVGADKRYVQGPFMVEGFLYGIVSATIVLVLFFPITWWLGGATEQFFSGVNVFSYYVGNFFQVSVIIVVSGILLGTISSFFAVRRYLTKKYLQS